ncbi:TlyA family RNA methyltransferase [Macrococcus lamae]|uniref:TlyA family RNA methyltransferase n=1 Tax=Macrococcus lamae TaxID=198484 RepID=A0A4R6BXL3_9STAP|nr:TlyA family RNA methyltransferase [Macrococcus lamae]TDM13165.1 TlyA family RNA methyltransferase [Macrococcus lamae]
MKKQRIDEWLVGHDYFDTIDEAKRYVMAGKVFNEHERIHSSAERINPETVKIRIKGLEKKYVSRGGLKLEKALTTFGLDIKKRIHIDIGSSTGGFTDCALKHGAKKSYAIDVGTNQLAYELRIDPRVTVMEQTNFRYVTREQFEPLPDFATIDVSFISLGLIFPTLKEILERPGEIVALIKPQFEADRHEVEEKGIVSDRSVHMKVIRKVIDYALQQELFPIALTTSPIKGATGNTEYLMHLSNMPAHTEITDDLIAEVVSG